MRFLFTMALAALPLFMHASIIETLKEGNARFATSHAYEREKLVAAQAPFCAVLACADSRVAPELIFSQSLGSLFVVRLAGNVATRGVIESLDFASNMLKVSLIVVMGHQNCGAVDAVWRHEGDQDLGELATNIQPSAQGKATLKEAVVANVHAQVARLKEDPHLTSRLETEQLQIVGAYYDFESGIVEFFEEKP